MYRHIYKMQKRESQKHMLQSANELCVFEMQRKDGGNKVYKRWNGRNR